ncbi:PPOX class F420-dependent enzyme [Mycobacterium sp. CBMA 234]|uniref:PPOX class F420-dependent oxidoreductase n=1 Tax=Mycolicibacterium sp. CBMA 234 TaxID=1918495 RepID=UPI0012DCEA2C|nr:PPOX class F420-dependent oxidoreductase [Mycolicibacterium sp. CBMA 234]MUL64719.1 PPOX class F420-dependent enzyme [Mycolicibacterium sp. CBMA 234]
MATNTKRFDISELGGTRYALLRSYRKSGEPVDTPIWFDLQGNSVVFRTKRGPKTARIRTNPQVELTACDYRGRKRSGATIFTGRATILTGSEAADANRALHRRYGWQWNVVPLIRIPGVTQVHAHLPLREKWRRARDRNVWADSAMVRIDFG